ncbi:MAG: SurA N-terminal domain-containing protein [Chloroflexi bacterium]|nr:SurA N-terminal domain-containing protein [Chloroflexota bacterium]MCL5276103.1 SurA N-terminal domain-containing protein [Chloroflexota bacterium]
MPKKPILSQRVLEQHTLSRYERERRTHKFVLIGSIVVAVVVVLLIGAAVFQRLVYEPNRAVAAVNGEKISVAQVQSRMRLEFADLTYTFNQLASSVQQIKQGNDPNQSFLLQFYQQQLQQMASQGSAEQISSKALDALITDDLVRQEARRRGLTVSQDEIQQEIEKSIGYYRVTLTPFPTYTPATPESTAAATATPLTTSVQLTGTAPLSRTAALTPTATATPKPTATPRLQPTSITLAELQQGKDRGVQFYTSLGYPASEFQTTYETNLLTKKVQDAMASEAPTMTEQYRFDYLRLNNVQSATLYADQLAANSITFEAAISQANTITRPEPIGSGAVQGWTSNVAVESQFGNEVLAALTGGALNKPSGVITSALSGEFYVVMPLEKAVRPLDAADLSQEQSKAYTDWLAAQKADTNKVQRLVDPLTIVPTDLKNRITQFQSQLAGGSQSAPSSTQ